MERGAERQINEGTRNDQLPGPFCLEEGGSISCRLKKLSSGSSGPRTSSRGHSGTLPTVADGPPRALHDWGSCRSKRDRAGEQITKGPSIP